MGTQIDIDELNRFLRVEMTAIESYQAALAQLDERSAVRDAILLNLKSHQERVLMLRDAIIAAGGEPVGGARPWGLLGVPQPRRGPRLVDEAVAIGALVDGEACELASYHAEARGGVASSRRLVTTTLLPAQQQTHDRLRATPPAPPEPAIDGHARPPPVGPGGRSRAHVATRHGVAPHVPRRGRPR